MLDDDDRLTRMNSCYVLQALFSNDDAIRTIDNDRLHKAYPDMLKRLDDVSDEIRLAICSTLNAYVQGFHGDFTIELYRAHLEDIAKILLIHMDDQNSQIQNAVFGNPHPQIVFFCSLKVSCRYNSSFRYSTSRCIGNISQ
jgi:dynein assembly factor 5